MGKKYDIVAADDYKEPEAVATLTAEGWVWDGDQWVLPRAPASVQDGTVEPMTEAQKRKLIGGFFAESWAVDAALELLHDYDRRLAAPHQGTEHPVDALDDRLQRSFVELGLLRPIHGSSDPTNISKTLSRARGAIYAAQQALAATPSRALASPKSGIHPSDPPCMFVGDDDAERAPASVQDEPWTKRDGETNAMYLERQARIAGETK